MLIDNVNLNHIRIFESVYRSRSMTRAAEELHITQSGVSQHIKHLEEILGVTLFDRVKQRLLATPQADHFYQSCKDGLYTIEKALTELKGVGPELKGNLTIGVPQYFISRNLNALIAEFVSLHPAVKFKIFSASSQLLWQMVQDAQIDLAIVDSQQFSGVNRAKILFKEEFVAIGKSSSINESSCKNPDKKFFTDVPFIDLQDDEGPLKKWFQCYFKGPLPRLNVVAVTPDWETLLDLCQAGLGLAVVPKYLAQKYQSEQALTEIKNQFQIIQPGIEKNELSTFSIGYSLATLPERTLSLAAQEFTRYVNERALLH